MDYARSSSKALDSLDDAERTLLATRAIEEMADRVLLLAADQKASKPLEKLIRQTGPDGFGIALSALLGSINELARNQYGSHVLESALVSWAERLGQPTSPLVEPMVAMCTKLGQENLWGELVVDPCSAHVVRALLLALGGFVADSSGKAGKGKEAARAGLLPAKKKEVPEPIADCRRRAAASLIKLLRDDDSHGSGRSLALNVHASPVIQLLLRVLREAGDHSLLSEACGAVLSPSLPRRCDELLDSAPGSRVLEAVIETAGSELYGELFNRFFRPRISNLAIGTESSFGPFLVQKLADGLREAPQLQLALSELDFTACLRSSSGPQQHVVVLRFLEAALRLRAGLKQAAGGVFRALELQASSQYHQAWPSLLSLGTAANIEDLYKEEGSEKRLCKIPAGGPLLLTVLLRFPTETVAPITSGLGKILKEKTFLSALAMDARGARVLEAALAPSSALKAARLKLAKAFKGTLDVLGPHPIGGWVCAALWRTSLSDTSLRTSFATELLSVEDQLRKENFAVWKICGLHQMKQRTEEWTQQQKKAGKIHALFEDILDGDPEAAKAAAASRVRAEEDEQMARAHEDPFAAWIHAVSF